MRGVVGGCEFHIVCLSKSFRSIAGSIGPSNYGLAVSVPCMRTQQHSRPVCTCTAVVKRSSRLSFSLSVCNSWPIGRPHEHLYTWKQRMAEEKVNSVESVMVTQIIVAIRFDVGL